MSSANNSGTAKNHSALSNASHEEQKMDSTDGAAQPQETPSSSNNARNRHEKKAQRGVNNIGEAHNSEPTSPTGRVRKLSTAEWQAKFDHLLKTPTEVSPPGASHEHIEPPMTNSSAAADEGSSPPEAPNVTSNTTIAEPSNRPPQDERTRSPPEYITITVRSRLVDPGVEPQSNNPTGDEPSPPLPEYVTVTVQYQLVDLRVDPHSIPIFTP
ncbi:hypothetical protein K402DRAFT_420587 [Aulographum hederae CBS 113979]|uniref:Uncharacterized protein n=1 Tax=Aulographum hederae CBS 113979 TaxID=1176131 RepID=A0A6G1H129_9PEZI|nr:hypothetical protein K402DRAFT_420587 [Aulographum hederae CBS 113979]